MDSNCKLIHMTDVWVRGLDLLKTLPLKSGCEGAAEAQH